MRNLRVLALLLCLSTAGLGFGPPALLPSEGSRAPLFAEQVPLVQRFRAPSISAAAAILSPGAGTQPFFAMSRAEQRAIASLTKMMTALLAIERGNLEQRVTVDVDASEMLDSSVMGLRPGEELTLDDLLYGLLLPSGNDAALAIAKAIGGSEPQFVDLMNQRAAELGMRNTRFANPHGLDDAQHFSTAEDLLVLAQAAMNQPDFARIVSTSERTVRGKRFVYQLRNTNRLLSQYPGVEGIKTGETEAAGQTLVATLRLGDVRIFSVVLGSKARFDDTRALLDYARGEFECRKQLATASAFDLLPPGPAKADENDPAISDALFVVGDGLHDCRPLWQARWRYQEAGEADEVAANGEARVGVLTHYLGDERVAQERVGGR